jgi:hypothetical protein
MIHRRRGRRRKRGTIKRRGGGGGGRKRRKKKELTYLKFEGYCSLGFQFLCRLNWTSWAYVSENKSNRKSVTRKKCVLKRAVNSSKEKLPKIFWKYEMPIGKY